MILHIDVGEQCATGAAFGHRAFAIDGFALHTTASSVKDTIITDLLFMETRVENEASGLADKALT
jgi:hypothetical protein